MNSGMENKIRNPGGPVCLSICLSTNQILSSTMLKLESIVMLVGVHIFAARVYSFGLRREKLHSYTKCIKRFWVKMFRSPDMTRLDCLQYQVI